ncbi:hypothetical protein [Streptomyces sp. NPDC054787]
MRAFTRTFLAPVTLTALALAASGCSSPSTAAGSAAASSSTTRASASDGSQQLDVAAAPAGAATPAAVTRPGAGGSTASKTALKVASFDKGTGRAVISQAQKSSPGPSTAPGAKPSASSSASAPATGPAPAPAPVKTGDIIASAPVPGAPDGLLAEVTKVGAQTAQGTEVETKPSDLGALLADDKAEGQVPVDPSTVAVEPLLQGVKVSWAKTGGASFGPNGAKLPLGSLRLDVGTAIATAEGAPASAAASVAGFVQLAPEVEFAYDGSARRHHLGMSGAWQAQWQLKGRAAGGVKHRIPFAKLHADPVIQVGYVPVVVNLDLTCYLQVEADGRITLDVEQNVSGDFRVGADYAKGKGWTPASSSNVKSSPVKASVTAAGTAKTTLGAEASVGLYGVVGLAADFAPYLRGEATATAAAATDGAASAVATWGLYGGFDLNGHLQLQLSIFGTPLLEHRIPLGSLTREWPLTSGGAGASASPSRPAA